MYRHKGLAVVSAALMGLCLTASQFETVAAQSQETAVGQTLTSGRYHTCGVTDFGSVVCWGYNGSGQTDVPENLGKIIQIAAGGFHTCALDEQGKVTCWGAEGDHDEGQTDVPENLGKIIQIAAGGFHTCALDEQGKVSCWGYKVTGSIAQPANLSDVNSITAGLVQSCAIHNSGKVTCWGYDEVNKPIIPSNWGDGETFQLAFGLDYSCEIMKDVGYSVRCVKQWGGAPYYLSPPKDMGNDYVQLSLNEIGKFACAVHSLGSIFGSSLICWGDNTWGQTNLPSNMGWVTQVATGATHACAANDFGSVYCWGNNSEGELNVPPGLRILQKATSLNRLRIAGSPCERENGGLYDAKIDNLAAKPQISGFGRFGQTLSGSAGVWASQTKICTFWMADGLFMPGNRSKTYKVQNSDVGKEIRFVVVGTKNNVSTVRVSDPVVVSKAVFTKAKAPLIRGVAKVGVKLSGSVSSWESGTSYTYQWLRDDEPIIGANTLSYNPTAADNGSNLSIIVCGFKAFYEDLCLSSSSQKVQSGVITKAGTVSISGKSTNPGALLTGVTTQWMPGVNLQSQWLLNGSPIQGATNPQLVIQPSYRGGILSYQVTGSMDGYQSISKTSAGKKIP